MKEKLKYLLIGIALIMHLIFYPMLLVSIMFEIPYMIVATFTLKLIVIIIGTIIPFELFKHMITNDNEVHNIK